MKYFIVNYKTYPQASGTAAVELTRKLHSVELAQDWKLIVCPQTADIYRVRESFADIEIWAQHVDLVQSGKATGWASMDTLIMAGITGTLINHSEHQLDFTSALETIKLAKEHDIFACMAVADLSVAQQAGAADIKPDMLAFEPPELIGSGISLMRTDPESARQFQTQMHDSNIALTLGAGIAEQADVSGALSLGYHGILVASAVVTAANPAQKLLELTAGI